MMIQIFWSGYGFAPCVSGVSGDFYDDSGILELIWFGTLGFIYVTGDSEA